jgi:hypothetical protein
MFAIFSGGGSDEARDAHSYPLGEGGDDIL